MGKIPWRGREWYRKEYLNSEHWLEFARIVREFWGNKCVMCNKSAKDVHHRTYERLGNERLQDVVLLCRDCHDKHHEKSDNDSDVTISAVVDDVCENNILLMLTRLYLIERDKVTVLNAEFRDVSGKHRHTVTGETWCISIRLADPDFEKQFYKFVELFELIGIEQCKGDDGERIWRYYTDAIYKITHSSTPVIVAKSTLLKYELYRL